ncbi:MAG: hypothetical protein LLG93_07670 [Deltaproteobacteria bacterium]|nr:hypothetical protein [Deltaproteobacteria bacterium]
MASGGNKRSANPDNYTLAGGVSLFVRRKGSTSIDDWIDLGNIVGPALAPLIETLDHFSQRRGQRAKDRSETTQRGATLNFSIDEINRKNLAFVLGNFEAPVASTQDVVNDETHANPGGIAPNNTIQLGKTGLNADVSVRNADQEDDTIYATPADYTLASGTGILTITPGGALANPVTIAELHILYTKTVPTVKFEGFPGASIELEARFDVFSKGAMQFTITAANCVLKNNGDVAIGDGTDWTAVPLMLDMLVDTTGKIFEVHALDNPGYL